MTARRFVLAGLVRGRALGMDRALTLATVRREGDRAVRDLLDDAPTLAVLEQLAAGHYARTREGVQGEGPRIRAARQVVGRVLAPTRRSVTDRAILAWFGVQLIESGWDTVAASRETIAVELGLPVATVRDALARLVETSALVVHAARPGFPHVYKVGVLRDESERMTAAELPDVIGALANDEPDRAARLIRSVASPRWCYSGLDHAHWVWMVADAAGVPAPVGRTVRRRVRATLHTEVDMDAAEAAKAAALAAREVSREERMVTLERTRALREEAHATVGWLLDRVGNPAPLTEPADRMAWVTRAASELGGGGWDRAKVRTVLSSRLERAGWSEKAASSAARAITREEI